MTPTDIVNAVITWAREVVPELTAAYNYIPTSKTSGFPDLVAEIDRIDIAANDPRLPFSSLQDTMVKVYTISLSVMVENDDPDMAATFLRESSDALLSSLVADYTLGGRVPLASPVGAGFDLTRPFVQYMDGTKAREATGTLIVGVPIEEEGNWL